MDNETKKMLILDGNSIVNRAYYAIPALNAPDGTPTNGVYGFLSILQRLLERESPDGVCVTFDVHTPAFRRQISQDYKAQRKPMPEDLRTQMPLLKELLDAMGICWYEMEGWEADDLMGTMALHCEQAGWQCRLATGDRDVLQLVTEKTHVIYIKTARKQTETIEYDPARFQEEYGFSPSRMVDLKALMGDPSDNYPGVPGIGEKTAMNLLHQFGSLEDIYENLNSVTVTKTQSAKLAAGAESARISYALAVIRRDAPLSFAPEDNLWQLKAGDGLYNLCRRLGFRRWIEKWDLAPAEGEKQASATVLPHRDGSVDELRRALREADAIAVVPLQGLDVLELCDGKAVFCLRRQDIGDKFSEILQELFSSNIPKLGHNMKDLQGLLLEAGFSAEGFIFDTALAGYLLESTASDYELSRLSETYLGQILEGAEAVFALYSVLLEKLQELGMDRLYQKVELPLCPVLAEMERTGFLVDRQALYDFSQSLTGRIVALQNEIWDQAGSEFNINSPKQLGEVLFDWLQLPAGKKTRTGWSTSAGILEKIQDQHPIVGMVLEYRELTKLKSTYADGLLKTIRKDGRVHTSFQMTATDSGRLSSRDPNLQNIPVRRELGSGIRRMFVAEMGNVLVDADYNQIELRLLAHISRDETMISAFQAGQDIHAVTASQVFGVPLTEVTPVLRSRAKAVNFGIVYGISPFSLAQDIGVTQSEAKAYIDSYLSIYHGVREYMDSTIADGKEKGYVSTLFGRRRYLPELTSSSFNTRAFGERVARNMPIQGTAADVMKMAMVRVSDRLHQELPEAKLLLQVHDELIVECPANQGESVATILKNEMENVFACAVPLSAEARIGASWAEAH